MRNQIITIFGSSRPVEGDKEYYEAYQLGKLLAESGYTICNGGYGGIMEAAARGAKSVGGKCIGVTCEFFQRPANQWIDKEVCTKNVVDRLMELIQLGDAYMVLKGGTGTLVELSTVWEFMNKRVVPEKPIIIVGDFWKGVVETLNNELIWEGRGSCTKYVAFAPTPELAVRLLLDKVK
jgi:uncharacterized protein (TIGR00730 family)